MRKTILFFFNVAMWLCTTNAMAQTDITNLAGTISAQYNDSPANEDIAKAIDNQSATKYLTFHNAGWIQFQSASSYVVTRYSITSANDAAERDPLHWTLQGSTNGTAWNTVDSRNNEDFPSRFQRREFTFTNSTAYTYYRLNMTNNSGTILQVAEWEIFGSPVSGGGEVTVYQHINYGGTSGTFAVGSYTTAQMQAKGIPDNWVSSVRVTNGYQVTFYDNDNFGGATLVKTADDATLVDDSWNDRASSMVVATASGGNPPSVPEYFRAIGLDGSRMELSWKDNSGNESLFRIERSTSATSGFVSVGTVDANVTTFVNTGLAAATKYYYRVRAENANGNSAYSNTAGAYTRETPPASMVDYVGGGGHNSQTMFLVTYNEHVAFYGDQDFINTNKAQVAVWIDAFVTANWQYIKTNYGHFGANRLYCFMHHNKFGGGTIASMFDTYANGRLTIDVGASNWAESNFTLHEVFTHEMAHLIEGSSHNVHESPFFQVWGDSKWAEIHIYDLYFRTGLADAQRSYNGFANQPTNGVYWLRDWFYPLWRDYGQTQFLYNMFDLLELYFPKKLENNTNFIYTRRANWGEFFYFLSGAAGVSLKAKATTVFGWPASTEAQWNQAKIDFPNITFTGKDSESAIAPSFINEPVHNEPVVSLWPNPSAKLLNIQMPEESGVYQVSIRSLLSGEKVSESSFKGSSSSVDLTLLQPGHYVVTVRNKDGLEVRETIKIEK
jgi:hypothetical protein